MSEERAGLTFKADIRDEEAKKKLVELLRLGDNVNLYMKEIDEKALHTVETRTNQLHDVLFLAEQVSQIMGLQLTATQQLALDMLQQGALATQHVLRLFMLNPATAVMAAGAYATLMVMQVQAYQEVQEKGAAAQAQYQTAQQSLQLMLRFMPG